MEGFMDKGENIFKRCLECLKYFKMKKPKIILEQNYGQGLGCNRPMGTSKQLLGGSQFLHVPILVLNLWLKKMKKKRLENFILNFGPKHPAAHGVLRLILERR